MLAVADRICWPTLGWKIAATNQDMRRRLRVEAPVFGRTFSRFLATSPAAFSREELLDPIVECEFIFEMGKALLASEAPHSEAAVRASVARVFPGVEVGECRFAHAANLDPKLLMADGFGSGRYVVGRPLAKWDAALDQVMHVRLDRDGVERSTGLSSDVMGHPVRALVWLANRLAFHGLDLKAGELVSSGSCTGMVRAHKGNRLTAWFGDEPPVVLAFT